ncbi:phosphatidate cytidylyltransferase [Candidatus Uabimicrobium sp. HlEnr_7]|uniref:phosphatidate cytidylyltransferase n=1 Tax=Candidatus Uabimicrobium helgolandensis TaxID=3095367 RepID=UPI003556D578
MNLSQIPQNILLMMGGIFGLLLLSTLITILLQKFHPQKNYDELKMRIHSWWVMASVFALAMTLNKNISLWFMAFVSFLAFKEYLSIIPTRSVDRRVIFWAYTAIPVQTYWIMMNWYDMFIIFIPVYMFLWLAAKMVLIGETNGFLKAVGTLQWGLMITVFTIGHMAYMLVFPLEFNPVAGGGGLVLYLVILTQLNDIAQFIWGKSFGRSKIIPSVSPNKTWAGFLGGVATTITLAWLLAPYLTFFNTKNSIVAGAIIAFSGFLGDLTMSAVKRDLGIKDTSQLVPGHGGILDRLDSLTYTAPLFFHFTSYLIPNF